MITIDNLAFSYGEHVVLSNISMKLEEGKVYGLLGENGVGKTTLLSLICGLKKCKTGFIDIDGHSPYDREPSFLSSIYYLPDEVAARNIRAIDYVNSFSKFREQFSVEKFREVMELFGTDPNLKMNRMSYGMVKKTYISIALACNTKYLVMDEPTNGLDIPSKAQFRKAISRYTSDDATLLISTHQVRDLESIIDPIIILDRQDVLLNAGMEEIMTKLYFDYGSDRLDNTLYSEMIPGGNIQVSLNTSGRESKVNIEALFNAVLSNKQLVKNLFGGSSL